MNKLIEEKLFFTGFYPYAVIESYRENRNLSSQIEKIELLKPWLWQLHGGRILVYCLIMQKKLKPVLSNQKMPTFFTVQGKR